MSKLSDIKPTMKPRIIDLVEAAGVDVSDWASGEGGKEKEASNPNYCYEWSFVEPKKLVVLTLWHDCLNIQDGTIVKEINYLEIADDCKREQTQSGTKRMRSALNAHRAIQVAYEDKSPIRVIVCDGVRRNKSNPKVKSRVKKRLLDPMTWTVTAYDRDTGQCTLTRAK